MKDYYVGFDIGTESVGWAVSDFTTIYVNSMGSLCGAMNSLMNVILLLTGELSEILEKELIERSKELHGYKCCLTRKYPK